MLGRKANVDGKFIKKTMTTVSISNAWAIGQRFSSKLIVDTVTKSHLIYTTPVTILYLMLSKKDFTAPLLLL